MQSTTTITQIAWRREQIYPCLRAFAGMPVTRGNRDAEGIWGSTVRPGWDPFRPMGLGTSDTAMRSDEAAGSQGVHGTKLSQLDCPR
jgi:hypothetical protein